MSDTLDRATTMTTEIHMLEQTEDGLEEDQQGDDNIADDLMIHVELVDLLAQENTGGQSCNHQDDADALQWGVDEENALREWQV